MRHSILLKEQLKKVAKLIQHSKKREASKRRDNSGRGVTATTPILILKINFDVC